MLVKLLSRLPIVGGIDDSLFRKDVDIIFKLRWRGVYSHLVGDSENSLGVDLHASYADLKVKMCAEGIAGIAHDADLIPRLHGLTLGDGSGSKVAIIIIVTVRASYANVIAPLPCGVIFIGDDSRTDDLAGHGTYHLT